MRPSSAKRLSLPANEPRYRFWGSKPPADRERPPILAEAPAAEIGSDKVARLRLYDPIDSWGSFWGVSAKEFASVLDELPDDITRIELRINSPGGDVFDGIAIMNQLRTFDAPVTAVVEGIAASAASFLAVACDELIMARNSELMIHDAWGICIGDAADMTKTAELLDHVSDNIASIYADKASGTSRFWRDVMKGEAWYSADEAVSAGLADRVDEPTVPAASEPVEGEDEADPFADAFDLSIFQHAGRKDAPKPPLPAAAEPSPAPTPSGKSRDVLDRRHALHARRLGHSAERDQDKQPA